jgi:hypothetical protein
MLKALDCENFRYGHDLYSPISIVPFVQRKIITMSSLKKSLAQITHLIMIGLGIGCLLVQPITLAESTKLSAEETINHIFTSDLPAPGATKEEHQNLMKDRASILEWLGSYQGVRKANDRSVIMFEKGSIPVKVQFEENGDPKEITANECPTTSVPIAQAPSEFRKELSECPNLKP